MAFTGYDPILGVVDLTTVDQQGPGPSNLVTGTGSGRQSFYNEVIRGYDAALGGGEFIYAKFSGTIAANTVCELTPSLASGVVINSATAWAGTANTGKPLAVAVSAGVAGQWGWFQVEGNAIVTSQGTPVAGNSVYWQAAGVVSPTAVAGKQVLNAQFSTAPSVVIGSGSNAITLTSTQAVVMLDRPFAQGAIT